MYKFNSENDSWVIVDIKMTEKRDDSYFDDDYKYITCKAYDVNLKAEREKVDILKMEKIVESVLDKCLARKNQTYTITIAFSKSTVIEILQHAILASIKKGLHMSCLPVVIGSDDGFMVSDQNKQVVYKIGDISDINCDELYKIQLDKILTFVKVNLL